MGTKRLVPTYLAWGGRGEPLVLRHVPWKKILDINEIWSSLQGQPFNTSLQDGGFSDISHRRGAGSVSATENLMSRGEIF